MGEPDRSLEAEQRARVVAVARSWMGTPFHFRARIKKVGIDCATLIAACFEEAELVPHLDLPDYADTWHMSAHSDEKYLAVVERHMHRIEGPPQPGDIALWKVGHRFSHGAVVIDWPTIVHAVHHVGCILDDGERSKGLAEVMACETPEGRVMPRQRRFYSFWGAA